MTYLPLTDVAKVLAWARILITQMTQRDAAVEKRLKDIEARLDAGNL